jgi:GAF domain-containing protein
MDQIDALNAVQALCSQLDDRQIGTSQFLDRCTRLVARVIGCARVGIWMFDDDQGSRRLTCLKLYDHRRDRMTMVPPERDERVSDYFDALACDGHVVARDTRTHPSTRGFFAESLEAQGVRSLLAVAFSANGVLYGAFTCTSVDQVIAWTPHQLITLKRLGAKASMALHRAAEPSTEPMPLAGMSVAESSRRAATLSM